MAPIKEIKLGVTGESSAKGQTLLTKPDKQAGKQNLNNAIQNAINPNAVAYFGVPTNIGTQLNGSASAPASGSTPTAGAVLGCAGSSYSSTC